MPAVCWSGDKNMEHQRVTYNFTETSVVFEVGGFTGHFSSEIIARFNCNVFIFEPVKSFYLGSKNKYDSNPKVKIFNFGLYNKTCEVDIAVNSDDTGLFLKNDAARVEKIKLIKINDFFSDNNIAHVDLIELNCEGSEYAIIEALSSGIHIKNIDHIQVQFHAVIDDYVQKIKDSQALLSSSHNQLWSFPGFECWRINSV